MEYPKILFITVNGWNNTTGTSTISSIINGYPTDKIANIFIRADKPNSDMCDRYFRIAELDVFKSIFKRNIKTGYIVNKEITDNPGKTFNNDREDQMKLKRHKNAFTPFFRDLAWKLGKWQTPELKKFILEFDPDIIMLPAEGIIHFNNIGLYASKLTGKSIGLFFWDDNFTYKSVNNMISKCYRFFLKLNIKKLVKRTVAAFSITPKMQKECYEQLGQKTVLITKPIVSNDSFKPYEYSGGVKKILYTGSIYIDRDKSIIELINAIKEINKDKTEFIIDIYTNSVLSEEEKAKLSVPNVSILHDAVTKEEVLKLQSEADILLFAEALNGRHRYAARLSFSTKLTDYFSAGRCILAIAPEDIAPTEYLANNDIALTADSREKILDILHSISKNADIMKEYADRAYKFGTAQHSPEETFAKFVQTVSEAVKGK